MESKCHQQPTDLAAPTAKFERTRCGVMVKFRVAASVDPIPLDGTGTAGARELSKGGSEASDEVWEARRTTNSDQSSRCCRAKYIVDENKYKPAESYTGSFRFVSRRIGESVLDT